MTTDTSNERDVTQTMLWVVGALIVIAALAYVAL